MNLFYIIVKKIYMKDVVKNLIGISYFFRYGNICILWLFKNIYMYVILLFFILFIWYKCENVWKYIWVKLNK